MMPSVGFMVGVVGLGSHNPSFKSHSDVELIPGGVDSACCPSEVGKMSSSMLVHCIGVGTCPGLCPTAKETAEAALILCTECGPNGWMDNWKGDVKHGTLWNLMWFRRKNIDFVDRELKSLQQHKLLQKRFHKLQKKNMNGFHHRGISWYARVYKMVTYQTWVLIHHPDSGGCRHHWKRFPGKQEHFPAAHFGIQ